MSQAFRACWRLIALPLAVSACAEVPPPYSPDYVVVSRNTPGNPKKKQKRLAPEACLTPDPTDSQDLGEHLPPGCANAYNLQRMTERESDLVQGRKLGPAPAGPSARAAQRYLNGTSDAPLGGGVSDTGPAINGNPGVISTQQNTR